MNILVSSTLQWNPGDEWIMHGCQNIIREALPKKTQLNWIVYNRNIDLMEYNIGYSRVRDGVKGNYCNDLIPYPIVDLFVQAGSPEYHGPPVMKFHEAVLASDKPYILMGVGSVDSKVPLTELDIKVLMRPNTYIYTRSVEAANLINSQLGVEKAEALPCPAICASLTHAIPSRATVQVPQTAFGQQKVKADYLEGLDKSMPVITQLVKEWEYYTFNGFDVAYNYCSKSTLGMVGKYERVISTRLHVGIVALGLGSEVVLVGKGDHRIETAAAMFDIPVVDSFKEAHSTIGKIDTNHELKWATYNMYKDIIKEIIK